MLSVPLRCDEVVEAAVVIGVTEVDEVIGSTEPSGVTEADAVPVRCARRRSGTGKAVPWPVWSG